jgi:protein-S-isoprenylcysteine O-methyltransferase Ste14
MWGYFLTLPLPSTLLMVVVLSLYIRIGIYFEEQKLIQEFGEQYETYRKKVPMLWPKRG